jgi:hypothetical protein
MTQEMTYSQWQDKYKPILNHITNNGDISFETYGEELDFINSHDPHYIWTEVQGDMCFALVAGRAFVNRLVYFVCENPWTDADEPFIILSEEKECSCYSEEDDIMESRSGEYGDPECKECEGYGYVTEYKE